jgi:hypothetical protein
LLYRYRNENSYQCCNHEGIVTQWWATELAEQRRTCRRVGKIVGQGITGSGRHESLV